MAKVLGTTEDYIGCDCCGRMNLKVYVAVEMDDGSQGFYGTSCAATMLKADAADIRKQARQADREAQEAAARERRARAAAEEAAWQAWLDEHAGPGSRLEQLARLGGYAEAAKVYATAAP